MQLEGCKLDVCCLHRVDDTPCASLPWQSVHLLQQHHQRQLAEFEAQQGQPQQAHREQAHGGQQ